MGIYVQGYGTLSWLQRRKLAIRLLDSARNWAADCGLLELFHGEETDTGAWLTFYPPAGGIAFEIDAGRITFGTKTSIGGPGYHAALVDLCDRLRGDLGIAWRWDSGGDQTNYAVDRSFARLREDFLDQVMVYREFHRDNLEPGELHVLNLPEGLAMDGYEGVATPLGPAAIRFFLDEPVSPSDMEALARRIFPWWSTTRDQEFWINTLRALLWTEAEWRAARTSWEAHVHNASLALASRLGNALDEELRQAADELAALSQDLETFIAPRPAGIGYGRRARAFFLPGGWRINLPGYYIEQLENDGKTVCLWFGNEEIRGTSFAITTSDNGDGFWSNELAGEPDRKGKGCIFRLDPAPRPSNSSGFFEAFAEFQTRDESGDVQLLLLSLFDAGEDLIPRLEDVAQRVWFDERIIDARKGGN